MNFQRDLRSALGAALVLVLAACGGGQQAAVTDNVSIARAATQQAATPPTNAASAADRAIALHRPACHQHCIAGTAAVGAAFANGTVAITDAAGQRACEEASITTSADGTYTCTVTSTAVAPLFVVVTDSSGNHSPVVSVTTSMPGNGRPLVVNATTLTTAIVSQLSRGGDPLALVASGSVDALALASLTTQVSAQLAPVLSTVKAPRGYDPFTTPILAATTTSSGNAADAVLDLVQVTTPGGVISLSTIGSDAAVPLGSTQLVSAPAAGAVSLVPAHQAFAAQLSRCFSLPTASRALAVDTSVPTSAGGPTVTATDPACAAIVGSVSNGAGQAFLHNGYNFGQFFYALLTRDSMTGASFSVPEMTVFVPADPSATPPKPDRAVLNFRFMDSASNPGNFIVVAANLASAPDPGWWIVGNQDPIDVNLRPVIRRVEELNPLVPAGHFQSGLQPVINAMGPGSVVGGRQMSAVRLTGPGLPVPGLVFVAPDPATEISQTYMDLSNVTGTLPASGRCGGQIAGNCPLFWLEQTAGLTQAQSAPIPNPSGSLIWRRPGTQFTPGTTARGSVYTIEAFYGTDTTPSFTFRKSLIADMAPASGGYLLKWNALGPTSAALLDPNDGTYSGTLDFPVTLDWIQNPLAEQVSGATMSIDYRGTLATTVQAVPGQRSVQFPALHTPALTPSTGRQLLFGYRTLDGGAKSAMYRWN